MLFYLLVDVLPEIHLLCEALATVFQVNTKEDLIRELFLGLFKTDIQLVSQKHTTVRKATEPEQPRGKGRELGSTEEYLVHLLLQVSQGDLQAPLLRHSCCQQGIFGVELSFQVPQPGLCPGSLRVFPVVTDNERAKQRECTQSKVTA